MASMTEAEARSTAKSPPENVNNQNGTTTNGHTHAGNGHVRINDNNNTHHHHHSRASVSSSNVDPLDSSSAVEKPQKSADPHDAPQTEIEKSKAKTALLMLALCLAVFLAALDVTIITTALPTIAEHFQSSAGYTWIGSAYLLGAAASVPIWAKFSDIFGRKPILLAANAVFFVGSLVAALSYSIGMLIAARAVQGIGGGGLLTLVNISIGDLFSMRKRGMYYGIVGLVWAIASAVGPLLGGAFTEKVTWRWCFWINLPFQGVAFTIIILFFKIHQPKTPILRGLLAIDWLGSLLVVGGILMVLFGLEYGGVSHPWDSAEVLCLIIFGVFTLTLFAVHEWKFAKYPVIPLQIFKGRSNIAVFVANFCHGYVFIGASFYLPLYFQAVLGKSPIISGVLLLANVLPLSLVSMLAGFFIRKTGNYQYPIWFGLFFQTLGFGLFIDFGSSFDVAKIIIFQIIAGIGTGPNFQAPLIALQTNTAPSDIAAAVASFQLVRNVATSVSIVVGSVVFQNALQTKVDVLRAALGPERAQQLSGFSAAASATIIQQLPDEQKQIARQVFSDSLQKMWIMYVCFPFVGLLVSLLIGKKTLSKEHEETKTGLEAEEAKRIERADARQAKRDSKAARKSVGTLNGDTPLASPREAKVHENGHGNGHVSEKQEV